MNTRRTLALSLAVTLSAVACEAEVRVLREARLVEPPRDSGTKDVTPKDAGPTPLPDVVPPPPDDVEDVIPPPVDLLFGHIAAGNFETCGVASGFLYCWGRKLDGRSRLEPELVDPAAVWRRVSNGRGAHCAERTTGSVFCTGANDEGQLGLGDTSPRGVFARVELPSLAIAVGGRFNARCAVLDTGALYCWGANEEGQLAQNDPFTGEGVDRYSPVRVGTDTDWTAIDVGQGHACGIRAGGTLYCWGRNTRGESGLGEGSPGQIREPMLAAVPTNWTAIATGQNHTCGLRTPGALYCFGDGTVGALGFDDTTTRFTPTQVGTFEDWIAIDLDTFHTCGIRAPGTLWCWGRNVEGQLGTGDLDDRATPTRIGDRDDWVQVTTGHFHTCARQRDSSVWCTGDNEDGRLGTGDVSRRNVLTPIVPFVAE